MCRDEACAWRTGADPTGTLQALIASSAASPVPAGGGRTAGAGELYDALLDGLYAQSDWPELGDALAADADGNGAQVVAMSDHYNQNGSSNGDDAAEAIDCLDHPVSTKLDAYGSLAAVLKATAPIFGPLLAWARRRAPSGPRRRRARSDRSTPPGHRRSSSSAPPVTRRRRTSGPSTCRTSSVTACC